MDFYKHPDPFQVLRQFYWQLRGVRSFDNAARVRWYRKIRKERSRLEDLGFSVEHVRLYCRYLSNPVLDSSALHRLKAFESMLVEFSRMQVVARSVSGCVSPGRFSRLQLVQSSTLVDGGFS